MTSRRRWIAPAALAALIALPYAASAQAPAPAGAPPAEAPPAQAGPKTPIPKTPLPPRDAPRAPESGFRQPAKDQDWPCVQPKVPQLSYGQMWGGPSLEEALKSWRGNDDRQDVVATLAARRTSIDKAKEVIDEAAKRAGADKDKELTLIFAGVFEEINDQRSRVVEGILRFARKQRTLAERIKVESIEISKKNQTMEQQQSPEGQKAQQALDWDTRIYDERAHSLTYVCETPVILEQRAFDLGRYIQSKLN